jgi:hypothetical protein
MKNTEGQVQSWIKVTYRNTDLFYAKHGSHSVGKQTVKITYFGVRNIPMQVVTFSLHDPRCSKCAQSQRDRLFRRNRFKLLRKINHDTSIHGINTTRENVGQCTLFVKTEKKNIRTETANIA